MRRQTADAMLLTARLQFFIVTLCALALSSCGSGGSGGGGAALAQPSAAPAAFTAHFTFTIAPKQTSARGRRPAYISSASQSLAINVLYGTTTAPGALINLTTNQGGVCTIAGGAETCTVSVVAQPGATQFVLTFYDQPNGLGNALSTDTVAVPPVTNGVANITATLQGIVANISLAVAGSLTAGTAGTATLALTAKDAAGNVITSGPFSEPIQLVATGSSISLSSTSVTDPAAPITISYNGGSTAGAGIIAKTSSVTFAFAPFGGPAPTPPPTATPTPAATPGTLSLAGAPTGNTATAGFPLTISQPNYIGAFTITATNATVSPAAPNGPTATVTVNGTPGVVQVQVTGGGGQSSSFAFNLYGPIVTSSNDVGTTAGGPPSTFTASQAGPGGTVSLTSACSAGATITVAPLSFPADGSVNTINVTGLTPPSGTPAHACVITLTGVLETTTVNVDINQNNVTVSGHRR